MLKPKNILIVEDGEDDSFILVHRLRKIGQFDIRDAADGEQAVVLVAVFFRQDLVFPRSIFVVLAALDATLLVRPVAEMEMVTRAQRASRTPPPRGQHLHAGHGESCGRRSDGF